METFFVSKVSIRIFAQIMRDKIIHTSCEMFLNLGFKSVTMDDIANTIGISKKTLYAHFENKSALVKAVTNQVFEDISCGIQTICSKKMNPIVELFEIKRFVMGHLKDEKSSPQYQLQKYYPKVFESLKEKQYCVMQDSIQENLKRGIESGLFRPEIDINFISKMYFNGMMGIKDNELFPTQEYAMNTLLDYYLDYHIRAISTPKGIHELINQIQK